MDKNNNELNPTVVSFKDVAGYEKEKEELQEIKDFLTNSEKYFSMGASLPKGLMLTGMPGVGKTLITRALAYESSVPLFEINSSVVSKYKSFAEAIEQIFKQAHKNAPCIIFIDEIHRLIGNFNHAFEDNHKMMNQLLIEMDKIDSTAGVIVVATANDVRNIDAPLLRPGRFDRHVHFAMPNKDTRKLILDYHGKNKTFSKEVSFDTLAIRTDGLSGAALATVLNEAAILSIREKQKEILNKHIDEALDRVYLRGIRNKDKRKHDEVRRIAIHEAGHAVVALEMDIDRIEKVTIQGVNAVGGFLKLISDGRDFFIKNELLGKIVNLYGGYIAERLILGEESTMAEDDLLKAYEIATNMVITYGMVDVSLVSDRYQESGEIPDRATQISNEISKILKNAYNISENILKAKISLILKISEELIVKSTLNREDLISLINNVS